MQLNGTECFLHQEQHRIDKRKMPFAREGLGIDAVRLTERLRKELLANRGDDFMTPLYEMVWFHPQGIAKMYLLCTSNSAPILNLLGVLPALPCALNPLDFSSDRNDSSKASNHGS